MPDGKCAHKRTVRTRAAMHRDGRPAVQAASESHPPVNVGPSIYTCSDCGSVV
jgi:hypothetical protein